MTKHPREKTELEKKLEAEAAAEESAEKEEAGRSAAIGEPSRALAEELEAVKAERDQLRDQFLRSRAEFDNYRKRKLREEEQFRKTAARALVLDLLPVLDHLELALQHTDNNSSGLAEGVAMVARQFRETLERHGVRGIPAVGLPFDPTVHEAVVEKDNPDLPLHTVLEEVQRGYMLGDQLLRPARVIVSRGGPSRKEAEGLVQDSAPPEGATDEQESANACVEQVTPTDIN